MQTRSNIGVAKWELKSLVEDPSRGDDIEATMPVIADANTFIVQPIPCIGGPDVDAQRRSAAWQQALHRCIITTLEMHSKASCVAYLQKPPSVARDHMHDRDRRSQRVAQRLQRHQPSSVATACDMIAPERRRPVDARAMCGHG